MNNRMRKIVTLSCVVLYLLLAGVALSQQITRPLPYQLPSRDTMLSSELPDLFDGEAGSHGNWSADANGHIIGTDGYRLKMFGTVLGQGAVFPDGKEAEMLVKRLRKLGFNAVRIEDVDFWNYEAASFFKYLDNANQINRSSFTVNPLQFARFDTLFYHLKKNGIHVVFTLNSQHRYTPQDGVMYPDSLGYYPQLAPFLDPQAAILMREWAKIFLTHVNPLTGKSYANEPALAIFEYFNEQSLFNFWNSLDRLVYIDANNYGKNKQTISWNYSRRLDSLYNQFLKNKYGTDANMVTAWCGSGNVSGKNLMENASFENPVSPAWSVQALNGASAFEIVADGGVDSQIYVKIRTTNLGAAPTTSNVRYTNTNSRLGKDTLYELSIWSKMAFDAATPSKTTRTIQLSVSQFNTGTQVFNINLQIDTGWKKYTYSFRPSVDGLHNVQFRLGAELGDVWFDACLLKQKPEVPPQSSELLSTYTVKRLRNDGSLRMQPPQRIRDQIVFLDTLEKAIHSFFDKTVVDTVKPVCLINRRQNGGGATLPDVYTALTSDVVDVHSSFDFVASRIGGVPYGDTAWRVGNNATVKSKSSASLPFMTGSAIKGKPMIVGEYLTPYANQFGVEQYIILPAWARHQDWDGLFMGYYSATRGGSFADSLPNWFKTGVGSLDAYTIAHNPSVTTLLPFAARVFRDSIVKRAEYDQTITHVKDDVQLWSAFLTGRGPYGVDGNMEANIYTQMQTRQSFNQSIHKVAAEYPYVADTATKISDTKQMWWDQTNGRFKVITPNYYATCGLYAKDTASFPMFSFVRKDDGANGKEMIALYYMSADTTPLTSTTTALLSFSTRAQNTGLTWIDSNGWTKNFGNKPVIVSAPIIRCLFRSELDSVLITPLDSIGRERSYTLVASHIGTTDQFTIELDPTLTRSFWYKVEHRVAVPTSVEGMTTTEDYLTLKTNPITGNTGYIQYCAAEGNQVTISMYDMLGREVSVLTEGVVSSGASSVMSFHTHSLSAGSYMLVMRSGTNTITKQVAILK
jgi:hypothetical protein